MNPLETMRAIASKFDPAQMPAGTKTTAQRDADKAVLQAAVNAAKAVHDAAVAALEALDTDPKNHAYGSLQDAEDTLHEFLRDMASAACEGSYCCGADRYEQRFFVGGVEYVAIASVEYNRHAKQFYYVDGFEFRVESVA